MFQDGSHQEIHCKTADSNGLVLRPIKINFTYLKFVKYFHLDRKYSKPSKQTILAVIGQRVFENWVCAIKMNLTVEDKNGRSSANIDAIRLAILKV